MTEPSLKDRLIEIAQLLPDFDTRTRDLLGLHGVSYDLTGIHANTGSPIENAYTRHEAHVGMLDQLAEVASDWGWEGAAEPVTWMSLNIDQVEQARGNISDEHAHVITRAHNTITHICKPRADGTRSPEQTRSTLIGKALTGTDIWTTTSMAAHLTGIPATTIRVRKHRGELETNKHGHINLREILQRT